MKETPSGGLRFKPLDMQSMKLVVLSDAAFGNSRGYRSQLGYVILLTDASGTSNIIHYTSNRFKRVTRSVLAAEVNALILAFDSCYLIQDMKHEIIGIPLDMDAFVDSRTLVLVVATDGATPKNRLQIDISTLREIYESGELSKINWMPGN